MKKLLVAITAVSSLALVAKADAISGTSFEGYAAGAVFSPTADDNGSSEGYKYWTCEDGAPNLTVTAYDGDAYAGECGRPDAWKDETNAKFLSVDTSARLTRGIYDNDAANRAYTLDDGGLFFDSLVQFTATESEPTVEKADKLVVWLKGTEGAEGAPGETNLVVTAGFYDATAEEMTQKSYVIPNLKVEQNTWYRLTIKTVSNIVGFSSKQVVGFVVYIDGKAVAHNDDIGDFKEELVGGFTEKAAALNDDKVLFPSLVQPGVVGCGTITSVSVEGTGAIDDISFTTTAPAFAQDVEYTYFTVVPTLTDEDEMTVGLSYTVDGGKAKELDPYALDSFKVAVGGQELVMTILLPEGYKADGYTKGAGIAIDAETTVYPFSKAFDISAQAADSSLAIAIAVVEDDGGVTPDFPEAWNDKTGTASDEIKAKFTKWAESNDYTATGAENSFLLGVPATGEEPTLTVDEVVIEDGVVKIKTTPELGAANGVVYVYKSATLKGLKSSVEKATVDTEGKIAIEAGETAESGFYQIGVGYTVPAAE